MLWLGLIVQFERGDCLLAFQSGSLGEAGAGGPRVGGRAMLLGSLTLTTRIGTTRRISDFE